MPHEVFIADYQTGHCHKSSKFHLIIDKDSREILEIRLENSGCISKLPLYDAIIKNCQGQSFKQGLEYMDKMMSQNPLVDSVQPHPKIESPPRYTDAEFLALQPVVQYKAVEFVLDKHIRPFLETYKGDVEVEDLCIRNELPYLTISYTLACRRFVELTGMDANLIESVLRKQLHTGFKVVSRSV